MSLMRQRKLSRFLIAPGYQIRYIFWLTSSGLVLVLINFLIAYTYIRENYQTLVELSPMTDETRIQLFAELRELLWVLGLSSLGFLILVAVVGLILSHRTAGPLYHLSRVFNEIRTGNLTSRARFRQKDEFQDVASDFNKMMDSLHLE